MNPSHLAGAGETTSSDPGVSHEMAEGSEFATRTQRAAPAGLGSSCPGGVGFGPEAFPDTWPAPEAKAVGRGRRRPVE